MGVGFSPIPAGEVEGNRERCGAGMDDAPATSEPVEGQLDSLRRDDPEVVSYVSIDSYIPSGATGLLDWAVRTVDSAEKAGISPASRRYAPLDRHFARFSAAGG